MNDRIRVVIADDHRLVREGLALVLAPACDIVGEAEDGERAMAMALELRPDVLVLDLGMPGIGGLAAAHRIARRAPAVKVLIVSEHDEEEYVLEAMGESGAAGYVLKNDASADLLAAVRAVHGGGKYLSPRVAPIVVARLSNTRANPGARGGPKLTPREREILRLIAQGATAKEIAGRLGISPRTAQTHRDHLKQKLDLKTTAAMVRYAVRHKLVPAGE